MTLGTARAAAHRELVVLWHPRQRAYLRSAGDGFTRRLSEALNRREADRHLEIEPLGVAACGAVQSNGQRSRLADLSDSELLRLAVQALRPGDRASVSRWAVVMDALALTSAAAVQLCRRLDLDPNERMGR